jgi:predicted dehydrogenase
MSTVSRRHFFQGATLALSATRVWGANDAIGVGIVGLGGRGISDHLRCYLSIPEARMTGLCDVNQAAREVAQAKVVAKGQAKAAEYNDMRKMFEDKNVDVVSIATPNHWHALSTIWAVQAGKDVYCEKPASHNIYEGFRMIEEARKAKRMVQVGSQSRSTGHKIRAMQMIKDGLLGEVYMAKGLCYKRRRSIGKTPAEPVPAGVDWDRFLGPAPYHEFTKNRFKYNWHWFWDTGNGDIGNQGIHEMDICRWALGDIGLPQSVVSTGGKFLYDDDQETPNTQVASLSYPGKQINFEVRGLLTGPEANRPLNTYSVGNLIFGSKGWMWIDAEGFQVYEGDDADRKGDTKQIMNVKGDPDATKAHMENLFKACRSRNYKELHADIEAGVTSVMLVHMANISYRTGHTVAWDAAKRNFGADAAANKLITRDYRKPYVV